MFKEVLSSSPETWGVDKQVWLLFAQVLEVVSLQRESEVIIVNRPK